MKTRLRIGIKNTGWLPFQTVQLGFVIPTLKQKKLKAANGDKYPGVIQKRDNEGWHETVHHPIRRKSKKLDGQRIG